jgi:hypothetical protein
MTRLELRKQLEIVLADLYAIEHMLEHAIRAGVPPDTRHLVQLDAMAKLVHSILAKLDGLKLHTPEESA